MLSWRIPAWWERREITCADPDDTLRLLHDEFFGGRDIEARASVLEGIRANFSGLALGCAVITLVTLAVYKTGFNATTAALLHLIVIMVLARRSGFWIASCASVVAIGSQMFFVLPPILSFGVEDPANWISLAIFEYCALMVSRLSAAAGARALQADQHRRETESLYEASGLVLLMDRQREPAPQLAGLIQSVFSCDAVAVFDADSPQFAAAGDDSPDFERRTRDTYLLARDRFNQQEQTWFCLLRSGIRPIGAMALRGGLITPRLAKGLSVLVAVAIERSRTFDAENRAQPTRHGEQLRKFKRQ